MTRIVLVTGAARGLGVSIAKKFLASGDIVYINYFKSELEAKNICREYNNAIPVCCDISKETDVKEMFHKINLEQGHIDILINNAAICQDNYYNEKTAQEFKEVLNTNLIGSFLTCKYAGILMEKQKFGSIINISSTNALDTNEIYAMDYDASKAGIISLTHNYAKALAPYVRVNAVAPGWINTHAVLEMEPHYLENEKKKIMLERFAEPEEVANLIFFLASEEASYINNSVIRIDGGIK